MKKLLSLLFAALTCAANAQKKDTALLQEVVIRSYFHQQNLLKSPASVSVISESTLQQQAPFSLVPAVNTVPGVRMEERSPGSYRLSVRGSLLRSPFGVRNIKVYLDDFMLTDASGNSYLNLLDAGSISSMEIIKGPEGSIYGANTGGVVLLNPIGSADSLRVNGSLSGGSYSMFHEKLSFQQIQKKFRINAYQSSFSSSGYRQQSKLDRRYIHLLPEWSYSPKGKVKIFGLFTDLNYQTPGGLTEAQFQQDPRSARAEALTKNAYVANKTVLAGLSHSYILTGRLRHVIAFTFTKTSFTNPAVANFEIRHEATQGLRSYVEYQSAQGEIPLSIQAGLEAQHTQLQKSNYINKNGKQGDLQTKDNFRGQNSFGFIHFSVSPLKRLNLESAVSANRFNYDYQSFYPAQTAKNRRSFRVEVMPRFAASYLLNPFMALRASVSRGFSPPSLEEVNPSGTSINTIIQAENGWNREIGYRLYLFKKAFFWDVVYFNYRLKDAIVRGVNANETDFYVNAGSTRQRGLESEVSVYLIPYRNQGIFRSLQIKNSITLYHFRFGNYVNGTSNNSGNKLTGVPSQTIVSSLGIGFPWQLSLFMQHSYTSAIPLNDSNLAYAKAYHLFTSKASWNGELGKLRLSCFAGIDNVGNSTYSLGNDLNAAGNRFYNAAPNRNYHVGISLKY